MRACGFAAHATRVAHKVIHKKCDQMNAPKKARVWVIIDPNSIGDLTLLTIIQAAGWPIWPLLICSVLALALIVDRFLNLKTEKIAPPKLLDEALTVSRSGLPNADVTKQLERSSLLGAVLASGFHALQQNPKCSESDLRSAMESAGRKAAHQLDKYMVALATIASAAPLLGLLGTVIGMIEIFGAQAPGSGSGNNPAQLAHGISVALYNTAFGLMVAIPALVFWRYFRTRIDAYVLTLELSSERFVRHLLKLPK
jgi:biopolymer transport protein ExbB